MEREDTARDSRPSDPAEGADPGDDPNSPSEQRKSVEQDETREPGGRES
ncbi:hypothetical protein ACXIZN_10715 [Amycolatopsis sp. TRM77291]